MSRTLSPSAASPMAWLACAGSGARRGPACAMVHETAALDRPALVQGLLKCVEHEAGVRRA